MRREIDTMRDNPTLSLESLTILEHHETEHNMILKTYKALYQFNRTQLKDLFW